MKKGFTLIELLAVIVILAIIALIATPIVVNIINDSKKESMQRSIDLYINMAQKAVAKYQMIHPDFNPSTCEILEKGNLDCNGTEIEVEMKGQVPESGTIRFQNNKIAYNAILGDTEYIMDINGKKQNNPAPSPATGEDYRGYYADVDGDGTVDGIIYADLNKSSEEGAYWGNSYGTYSYTAKTNLNEYTVSNNKYKKNDGFGENKIIKLKKNKNNPRFYVMALEDFITMDYSRFYWYYEAIHHMSPKITSISFDEGKDNTRKMIAKWNAAGTEEGYQDSPQNNQDIWKYIQSEYAKGWYIPSREEWAAFADYFTNLSNLETKLTTSNYNSLYGLLHGYWTSSQGDQNGTWYFSFQQAAIRSGGVNNFMQIRVGTTF